MSASASSHLPTRQRLATGAAASFLPMRQIDYIEPAMSPKELNEAIGRSLGWKSCSECGNILCDLWVPPGKKHYRDAVHLPDFVNDLNAMHAAERWKVMDESSITYLEWLTRLSCPWCATAAQRAEAFLRTLGLWEGEQR